MNTHTLALVALVLGVAAQAINVWNLARKLLEARLRRLERRLGLRVDAEQPSTSITVADIAEIRLKRPL